MILKTIINTKYSSLSACLLLSVALHGIGWLCAPELRDDLRLNELYNIQSVISPDHFVEVKLPIPKASAPVGDVEERAETVKSKPPRVKRRLKKRSVKRRSKKARKKRKVRQRKPEPVVDLSSAAKPTVAHHQDDAPEAVASTVATAPPSPQGVTEETEEAQEAQEAQVTKTQARQLSKRELRGLLRGYVNNLNQLMSVKKTYPRSAKRLKLEGKVFVHIVISSQGEIMSVRLARSSGHELLDKAAIAQVQKMGRVPSIPKQIDRSSLTFEVGLDYSLQS